MSEHSFPESFANNPSQGHSPLNERERLCLEALEDFYSQLTLSEADRRELWEKRGHTVQEIELAGYRTNSRNNLEILQRLAAKYDKEILVESGLWSEGKGDEAKPNVQFYGFGIVRRKRGAETEDVWGWKDQGQCNPILIPYWSNEGRLIQLRPHKGGIAGKPPHLYVARSRGTADRKCTLAVITEGEFKARALRQGLAATGRTEPAIAALPGISMSKHQDCFRELVSWLRMVSPSKVVIAFDNEEKGDPKLPSFKPNPRKRYDTVVWARYLAHMLVKAGFHANVATLPDEWRLSDGKADWDSRLAARIAELKGDLATEAEIWRTAGPVICQEFMEVLKEATPPGECRDTGIFTEMEERLIQLGLNRLYRESALPFGGEAEMELSRKLKSLAWAKLKDIPGVYELGEKYRQVVGGYYKLQPFKDKQLDQMREQAQQDGIWDLVWFCDLKSRGIPAPVSNFKITCHYTLVMENGRRMRIVSLENARGEKAHLVALGSRALTAPRDLREWLADTGNFAWMDGERNLEAMHKDMFDEAAFLEVFEVTVYGDYKDSGIRFFEDAAYGPDGQEILADELGVFWFEGKGYKIAVQGSDNQEFRQPAPKLRPNAGLVLDGLALKLVEGVADDPVALKTLFQELSAALRDWLGGYDGYMALGAYLAFGAAREIFLKYGAFPGLWTTGEKGSGKTTLNQLLMESWGFANMQSGIGLLRSSSATGLQIAMEQFSNLPVWADEFRENQVDPDKRAVIHAAFNRELASKFSENGRMRKMRTGMIISGESTTSDAATRSRYPHIHLSKTRGRKDNLVWLLQHRSLYFVLGRFVMRQRVTFAKLVLEILEEWNESPSLATLEPRARLVYGVAYAAFMATARLLDSHAKTDLERFRFEMISFAKSETDDVQSQTDVFQFLSVLYAAFVNGAFGTSPSELGRYFGADRKEEPHPPGAPNQNQVLFITYNLYLKPGPVIDVMRRYMRAQGLELRLNQLDLRRQLATHACWIPAKHGIHRRRFGGKHPEGCWGIALHLTELGYSKMSDEEWLAHLEKSGLPKTGGFSLREQSEDPRHGDLFAIVHKLLAKE